MPSPYHQETNKNKLIMKEGKRKEEGTAGEQGGRRLGRRATLLYLSPSEQKHFSGGRENGAFSCMGTVVLA